MIVPNRDFMQICWVVPDLQAAMAQWTKQTGVGPFIYFDEVRHDDAMYRGKPWEFVPFEAAIAQAGHMQIELVSNKAEGDTLFREVVPEGQSGLHHMATCTDTFDEDLEYYMSQGAEVAFSGLMMGARVYYLDTVSSLGFMLEMIESNPNAEAVFAQIRQAAVDWDGSDPVRTLS